MKQTFKRRWSVLDWYERIPAILFALPSVAIVCMFFAGFCSLFPVWIIFGLIDIYSEGCKNRKGNPRNWIKENYQETKIFDNINIIRKFWFLYTYYLVLFPGRFCIEIFKIVFYLYFGFNKKEREKKYEEIVDMLES